MVKQNIFFAASKSVFIDIIGDVLYFPIWWYTRGLVYIAFGIAKNINAMADHLALRLLVLNIFKPMFAQYDRAGRMISFFMRIVILIFRLIYFGIFTLLQLVLLLAWVGVPLFTLYRLVNIYFAVYV